MRTNICKQFSNLFLYVSTFLSFSHGFNKLYQHPAGLWSTLWFYITILIFIFHTLIYRKHRAIYVLVTNSSIVSDTFIPVLNTQLINTFVLTVCSDLVQLETVIHLLRFPFNKTIFFPSCFVVLLL